ncbi:IclR family transcriptional regulator [Arthrobacter sp. CAU 1506]|uniref:IclR family transcriptional regulator n=1 Tax=Arthrobacter sp. CAU 1506 TaxID=2560052 RepID=UPI0010AD20FA|nr:IclR family transcriptional regulator [Arthrobacter sp. CAU 1506]TJY69089.1 IclR family transcriptional regulator [Arthrobacter sp. CAU 1506]
MSIVKKPGYAVDSVDRALQLIVLLQERDWLRITDAATSLDVAPSTAHRLMAMLVYRGFALQDDQRRYCAGPALRADSSADPTRAAVSIARPHLEALALSVRETVNLVERVGVTARYLFTAEGPQLLRVGNRTGSVLPAHLSSGGKAILATLPAASVAQLYTGRQAQKTAASLAAAELDKLQQELTEARERGYAVNLGRTEADLAAVGAPLATTGRAAALAISITSPLSRGAEIQQPEVITALHATCQAVLRDLQAEGALPTA